MFSYSFYRGSDPRWKTVYFVSNHNTTTVFYGARLHLGSFGSTAFIALSISQMLQERASSKIGPQRPTPSLPFRQLYSSNKTDSSQF